MRKWVDELFIIIMDMLQDSSLLAKRQVSTALSGLSRTGPWEAWALVSLSHSLPPASARPRARHTVGTQKYLLSKGKEDMEPEFVVILTWRQL